VSESWPVEIDEVLVWLSVWSEVQIVCTIQLMPLHPETP